MKLFTLSFVSALLSLQMAHAAQPLQAADEQYQVLGLLEAKTYLIKDDKAGPVVLFSADNGSAANPVQVYFTLPAIEQQGDNGVSDVYLLGGHNNGIKSATRQGNKIVVVASHYNVETDKPETIIYKVTYRNDKGERLATPTIE